MAHLGNICPLFCAGAPKAQIVGASPVHSPRQAVSLWLFQSFNVFLVKPYFWFLVVCFGSLKFLVSSSFLFFGVEHSF